MQIDTSALEEIGFTKGEIRVYFALLELGESSIGPIAAKSKVTPAKVYLILDKLTSKGLCASIIKSDTKYFTAAQPQRIMDYLDEKKKKIDTEKQQISKLIPIIEQKRKLAAEQQTAQVYQTFDGMRTLYNEMIETLKKSKEDFLGFTLGAEEYRHPESIHFFREYDRRRRENGILLRLIGPKSPKEVFGKLGLNDSIKYRQHKTQLPTGVIIFGNKVATMVWGEIPTAFVIESKTVAKSYKRFFEDTWKQARP